MSVYFCLIAGDLNIERVRSGCLYIVKPSHNFVPVHNHVFDATFSEHFLYDDLLRSCVFHIYTVKLAHAVTSIKQSTVLKGHLFFVLS